MENNDYSTETLWFCWNFQHECCNDDIDIKYFLSSIYIVYNSYTMIDHHGLSAFGFTWG